jgi:hypothetical protein
LQNAITEGLATGELDPQVASVGIGQFLRAKLNHTQAGGLYCSPSSPNLSTFNRGPGTAYNNACNLVLHNGALIQPTLGTGNIIYIVVDANWDKPPNYMGQDSIYFQVDLRNNEQKLSSTQISSML